MNLITFVCAFVALFLHLMFDAHKEADRKPIVHWLSALIVVSFSVALGCGDQIKSHGEHKWQAFAIFSLLVHLSLFDPIWNWFNKHAWNYHGTPGNPNRALTDKAWEQVPPLGEIFFRAIFLTLGFLVYLTWDKIVQGGWLGYGA